MKTFQTKLGLLSRLGAIACALLLTQQAMATGTDPGVAVDNTATVNFNVGGNAQTPVVSNTASFVVDRRVDFSVSRLGTALTTASIGDTQAFLDFYVTNLSNGVLDFNLSFAQLIPADGDIYAGLADSGVDMNTVSISVSPAQDPTAGTGDGPDPVFGGPTTIDDLPEDQSIRVRLFANAPATAANGAIAGLSLTAVAADPASGLDLTASGSWTPGTIDNVFADADNNNSESNRDGFLLQAAELTVTKTQAVISDPFSSGLAVPGARIEYTITLDNSTGTVAATGVSIADAVDSDVTFVAGAYSGGNANISFSGGTFCLADAADANGDGCTFDGTNLTIAGSQLASLVPLDVAAGAIVTVKFVVEIPTT
ncbi:MAG TPA: hypothetical protein PKK10_18180 [Woeseiaceae bacterium]|nr:hypothetical protein [Woeseiaceae bacterium]